MYYTQLKELVDAMIAPLPNYSTHASNLILGTIAQESNFGYFIKRYNGGGALGITQMERPTFTGICNHFWSNKPALMTEIQDRTGIDYFKFEYLEFNLALSISMTRLDYLMVKDPIPETIGGYAMYWKRYYNTYKGKGTIEQFINNYHKYILQ